MTQMSSEGRTFKAPAEQSAQPSIPAGFVKAFRIPGNPPFLKEIKTGAIWPFTEGMAMRGDFVVGVYDLAGSPTPPESHPDYGLVVPVEAPPVASKRMPPRKQQAVTDVIATMQG
jgi:hypothetical protein